jgi:exodeoxyribonuclease VII large subunit
VTLIDFASDRRAPTPTAAAEIAVPVRTEMIGRIDGLMRRALSCWTRGLDNRRTELRAAMRALPSADALLAAPRQRLDAAADRLPRALIANAQVHHTFYSRIAGRLTAQSVMGRIARERERVASFAARAERSMRVQGERHRDRFAAVSVRLGAGLRANAEAQRVRIARARERLDGLMARAATAIDTLLDRRDAQLEHAAQLLTAFSYHGVLARGFALVRSETGKPLRSAAAVNPGARMDVEFADGRVRAMAEVRDLTGPPTARPALRRKRRREPDPGQGSLF